MGVRGSRIKNIVAELGGEKIDIVPWSPEPEMFISKALSPAEIYSITLNSALNRARVVVPEDQLSLAIGKKGQNVRLAARLTKWDIDVMSKDESDHLAEQTRTALSTVEGASEDTVARLARLGYTITDLARSEPNDLVVIKGLAEEEAVAIVEGARRVLAEGIPAKPKSVEKGEEEAEEEGEREEQAAEGPAAEADEDAAEPAAAEIEESADADPDEASAQAPQIEAEEEPADESDEEVSEDTEESDAGQPEDAAEGSEEAEEIEQEAEEAEQAAEEAETA